MEEMKTRKRRKFIKETLAFALSFSIIPSMAKKLKPSPAKQDVTPALAPELVRDFVIAAHFNLDKVKEMLAKEAMLANASWDWGGGDFELAIGGAAHMGNRDIANYLLDHNARIDIFSAAMLGEKQVVESLIKMKPGIVHVSGPHTFPLLYHVAISGNIDMAAVVVPQLLKERIANDCNRSLQAAARSGDATMIEWLLTHGADNLNVKDVFGKTPLQIAEEKNFREAVVVLKKFGAK
jgi:ankyrin repeat protein